MELHNLSPASTAKPRKRVGRGQGSGKGGTSTRGHKGAKSRSGYSKKLGFEGGQMPLQRRVPKFGFKNHNRVEYIAVNVEEIQKWIDDAKFEGDLTLETLAKLKGIRSYELLKVLGNGELKASVNVTANKFSASAIKTIEAAGGKAIVAE